MVDKVREHPRRSLARRRGFFKFREGFFLRQIDLNRLPSHVAVIMDGNGRWAKKRGLPRIEGHEVGVKTTRQVVEAAVQIKLAYLTLYTFSMENWQRPKQEVEALMNLFEVTLQQELPELNQNKVKVNIVGEFKDLPRSTQKVAREAMISTQDNSGLLLNIALNYGGRFELTRAFQKIMENFEKGKKLPEISPELIETNLYTAGMPDPELLIRTSGEYRLSNFLLWQLAYTELWVTPVFWPDFTKAHFFRAILAFQQRKRRFGGLQDF